MEYEVSIDGLQVGKEHFTPKKLKEIITEIDRLRGIHDIFAQLEKGHDHFVADTPAGMDVARDILSRNHEQTEYIYNIIRADHSSWRIERIGVGTSEWSLDADGIIHTVPRWITPAMLRFVADCVEALKTFRTTGTCMTKNYDVAVGVLRKNNMKHVGRMYHHDGEYYTIIKF
jgi:hypothetical protein